MSLLSTVNQFLIKILRKSCVVLLAVFTLVVLLQIATRNYIKIPMGWTAEVSLLCFLWSVYLGSAVAVKTRAHYVIELLPPKFVVTNALMNILADLAIFSLIFVLMWGGAKFTQLGLVRDCTSIPLSMAWLFVVMPLSGCFMFLFGLENLWEDCIQFKKILAGSEEA